MKKILMFVVIAFLIISTSACGNTTEKSSETDPTPSTSTINENSKSLVVYFSWSGNTENVAKEIQTQTNADIFEIVAKEEYTNDYDKLVDQARQEQREHKRPQIKDSIENLSQYDTIYVGYPNWWGDMPMILYTFFDEYDFSQKNIAPFCTSGGSGLSETVETIKQLEPEANVTNGLHISSSSAKTPSQDVEQWLSKIIK